jgi:hypothetical protein
MHDFRLRWETLDYVSTTVLARLVHDVSRRTPSASDSVFGQKIHFATHCTTILPLVISKPRYLLPGKRYAHFPQDNLTKRPLSW